MRKCSQCGAEIERDEAAFCAECGCAVEVEIEPQGEGGAKEYKQAVENAWADGIVDDDDRRELDNARSQLQISESEAARLEQQTRDALAREERRSDPDGSVIGLELNDSHFYMEKRAGVIDLAFVNNTSRAVNPVRLAIKSKSL